MITEIIVDILARMSSEFIMTTSYSYLYPDILSEVDDGVIKNQDTGKETQKVYVNMSKLFEVLSKESKPYEYANDIAQQCKRYGVGINIEQMKLSNVMVEKIVKSAMDVFNDVKNNCGIGQKTLILTREIDGFSIIEDVFPQIRVTLVECVRNAVENNEHLMSTIRELNDYISLSNDESKPFHIIALIGCIILCVKYNNRYSFLAILLIGTWFIVSSMRNEIIMDNFSDTILSNNDRCDNTDSFELDENASTVDISRRRCLDDPKCYAFDYRHNDDNQKSFAKFYMDPGSKCKTNITSESFVLEPMLYFDRGLPENQTLINLKPGDVYVDKQTSVWYQTDRDKKWQKKNRLIDEIFTNVIISRFKPYTYASQNDSGYLIELDTINYSQWIIYKVVDEKWIEIYRRQGPGYFVYASPSDVSGFKINKTIKWMLYIGVFIWFIGLGGMIYSSIGNVDLLK